MAARPAPTSATETAPALSRQFGFVQFDFAGTLPLGDGRYLARTLDERGRTGEVLSAEESEEAEQSVLVVATTGAPPPGRRRRRRPREVDPGAAQEPLPLTRVTAIRAFEPFADPDLAGRWLDEATEAEDTVDILIEEGIGLVNRALHAQRVATGDAYAHDLSPRQAVAVRIGFGSGDEVAEGRFAAARTIDMRGGRARRRHRDDLRPQERVAAALGGRERLDACETLLLRARADLDAGRWREAALQLRVGLEALLVELRGALADPGHDEDMAVLEGRRSEAGAAANAALQGELEPETRESVRELIEVAERVLRRRRVLRG